MSLGPLFGLAPSPIFVVPVGTAITSGLAGTWRVMAFPALGWPARRDVLCWGHGLRHFPGFLSLGARLDAVDPAREPVPFGAPVTPSLSFDSRLVAVPAEAAGLGFGEFLLVIGPFSFFSGLGRQRDSLLFAFLRCCPFFGSFLFGIVGSRARLFLLASSLGAMVSIDKKLSFRMVYSATTCPTLPKTLCWRLWPTWAVPGGALKRSSRRKRATWAWTNTRPGVGPAGITTSSCACWAERSCWACSRLGGKKMPQITRPQSLPSCKRGCTGWCGRCCPGNGSARMSCCCG